MAGSADEGWLLIAVSVERVKCKTESGITHYGFGKYGDGKDQTEVVVMVWGTKNPKTYRTFGTSEELEELKEAFGDPKRVGGLRELVKTNFCALRERAGTRADNRDRNLPWDVNALEENLAQEGPGATGLQRSVVYSAFPIGPSKHAKSHKKSETQFSTLQTETATKCRMRGRKTTRS